MPSSAPTVNLFPTCLAETFRPRLVEAVVQALRRAGVQVRRPPGLTCCGQPAFNAGDWPAARRMAQHTIRVLEAYPGPVVLPAGSCTAMIRHHYARLFAQDAAWLPRAQALAARTYELSEYLVEVRKVTDLGVRFPYRLTYHPSCHLLRALGVDRQPRALLAALHGAEFVELPHAEECCGFGGVFSAEYPEIARAMLARKVEHIAATGADFCVTADPSCLLHIQGGLNRAGVPTRMLHLAEVLAWEEPPPPSGTRHERTA